MDLNDQDDDVAFMLKERREFVKMHPDAPLKLKDPAFDGGVLDAWSENEQENSAVEAELKKAGLGDLAIAWLKNRAESNNLSLCLYTIWICTVELMQVQVIEEDYLSKINSLENDRHPNRNEGISI